MDASPIGLTFSVFFMASDILSLVADLFSAILRRVIKHIIRRPDTSRQLSAFLVP